MVPVKNWFNHTCLSELTLRCTVDGAAHDAVTVPDLAPYGEGLLTIEAVAADAHELELTWTLDDREIDAFLLNLAADRRAASAARALTHPAPSEAERRPVLELTPAEIIVTAGPVSWRFSRRTGLLTAGSYQNRDVITGGPMLHLTGAELFRPWSPTRTPYAAYEADHVIVVLQGGYGTRVPLQFICRIYGDGRMTVEYQTRVTNINAAALSEWGLSFELPDDVRRVSWVRDAPYARYPEGHIARPVGTAERDFRRAREAGYRALPTWPWELDMYDAYLAEPNEGAWRVATNDFKALREHIHSYRVAFASGDGYVEARGIGDTAARVELAGAHPRLVIDQQWWYPGMAWGNDCGRPVQLVEGTGRGEVCLVIGDGA